MAHTTSKARGRFYTAGKSFTKTPGQKVPVNRAIPGLPVGISPRKGAGSGRIPTKRGPGHTVTRTHR